MANVNEIITIPVTFNVTGNIIPAALLTLADTTPFTAKNATLSILTATTIDGHSLKRLQVVPSW